MQIYSGTSCCVRMMLQHILETFNELTVLNNRDGEVTQVKMRMGARVGGFLVIMDMHVLKCTQVQLDIEHLRTLSGWHANR